MGNNNKQRNRLVNAIRLYRPYVADDFKVTSTEFIVRKDRYGLNKIKRIQVNRLGIKDNLVRILSLALLLSASTWAFAPGFGLLALALSLLLALVSMRKFELRAEFSGTDETGDHWVSVVRCCTEEEFNILKSLQSELSQRL
ncbi:hypothetical protein EK599_05735 [Vibrio sp. T187]|uniref:DUF6232 family protein n=1 Tax=Vibrio TaxID=662 RepID=UPI0010C9E742|nr:MULTISPECIES: DUF6232 family protein [Vibrio]MBW3695184.1 hypothetical protein [Vibrio sp. T187]